MHSWFRHVDQSVDRRRDSQSSRKIYFRSNHESIVYRGDKGIGRSLFAKNEKIGS